MSARRATLAGGFLVVLVTIAATALVRWSGPAIYDGDGWYHVKYAQILRHDGIARTFPWFQESFQRERFTDFNLLYHVLLIPFTAGNPLTGARVATVLLAGVTMGLFWWTARALRVPWPALWSLALLALAPEFAYRLTYTRPLVLAIGLGVAGTGAILLGRRRLAFACALLYTHLHCSYHLLPCVALLHDVVRDHAPGERLRDRFQTTLWTIGGVAAGSVLTPYFPNNLHMWWVANVEVLRASWAMGDALRVGTEMLPMPIGEMVRANPGLFAVFFATPFLLVAAKRTSPEARTLFPMAIGFFGLSLLSQRFVELWAPFAFLLAGVALRDAMNDEDTVPRAARRPILAAAVLVVVAALAQSVAANRAAAAAEDPPEYLEAGAWIGEHVPPGETIFNLGWDEFPQLFYADSTHNYLIGQDATFMWVTDPERTRLWTDVARGRSPDLHAAIRESFRCRFVVVPKRYVTLRRLTRRDPRFHEVWSDGSTSVLKLDDDGRTLDSWSGRGWQPDPERRYFDVPLDAEPGATGVSANRSGPGTPGRQPGFVDLGRLFGVPPSEPGACAVVTSRIDAVEEGPIRLGLTSDDEIKLYLNGTLLHAHSPYRTPPPGAPGGPPIALDALFAPGARRVTETALPATVRAGANAVVIKACRYGDDFGFVLRRL